MILPSGLANAQSRVRSRSTSSAGRSSGGEQRARDSWQPVRVAQVPRKKFVATPLRQTTFQDEEVAPLADAVDAAAGEIKGGMTPRAAADGNARANANANRQPAPVPNQALPISPSPLPPATVMTPMPGEIVYQDAMPMTHGGGCGDCGTSRCRTQACNGSVYPSIGAFLFGTRGGSCGGCDGAGCDSMGCDSVGCGCGACGTGAWSPCNIFRGPRDAWVSVEGLVWAPAGMRVPPLVTTSPTGSARAAAGVLEQTGTSTLVGGEILDDDFSGVRLRFGFFLDACHEWGITGEYFDTDSNDYSFFRNSTGDPILARPFFNTETGLEDSELVAFPNVVSGSVAVDASTQLQGWSLALTRQVFCNSGCGGFFLAGNPSRYTQSL
ncbi:MAG: BBP7 family outer membrane beta-barrel protein, partial [Planctomycetota bacterium]